MPSIAIVILNWNGKPLLERFLPEVIKYSKEANIYLADNASTDSSVIFTQKHFPTVKIIQLDKNYGFAGGYNLALEQVQEDILCLLNSDVAVTKNWLKPILEVFETNPDAGIVQPKIKNLLKPDYFEYAGAAGGFLDRFGYPFCRGRIFQTLEEDTGQYDDVLEIFWATGACMFIRKSIFSELGGFDSNYFAHQEEVDLCWRAQNQGFKVFYTGWSTVYHLGGSTLSNMNPKKTYLNFRNSLFSLSKNLPLKQSLPLVLSRLILDGLAALRFIFQGKWKHAYAILQAHLSYYRMINRIMKQSPKIHFKKKYYITTSIVWSYFVNHKENFNNLAKD
ncbi:MAG: hypothetical protein RLZZ241_1869 [Bacteroidota bacterium]|jgi:GT2 family glycosyltransferase